ARGGDWRRMGRLSAQSGARSAVGRTRVDCPERHRRFRAASNHGRREGEGGQATEEEEEGVNPKPQSQTPNPNTVGRWDFFDLGFGIWDLGFSKTTASIPA